MCDDDDGDPALASQWRRARKPHVCCSCGETIERTHMYHHSSYLSRDASSVSSYKHCARCWAICRALWDAGAGGIDMRLNCGEDWEDNFGPLPYTVARLAFLTPEEAQKEQKP